MTSQAGTSELDKFRELVLSEDALQEDLGTIEDVAAFAARASLLAGQRGIAISADDLKTHLRDDPIGLSRRSPMPLRAEPPQDNWLPIHIAIFAQQITIDWAYFGAQRFADPFFEESIRIALRHPLNRLVKCRTLAADLPRWVERHADVAPSGFIFHMSRCGSTLVSQMLASDPRNVVISEASPIDKAAQIDRMHAALDVQPALLRGIVAALGRANPARRYFIKLDSWHTLALPLFRRAFPSVPWVFLYRDPVEVMTSQMLQPGMQAIPDFVQPAWFGLEPDEGLFSERYCARVIGRICEAVLQPYDDGSGLLVNYDQLPEALWTAILPHFGVPCGDTERKVMAERARQDSKAPDTDFSRDSGNRRRKIQEAVKPIAEEYLRDVYDRLEALNRAASRIEAGTGKSKSA